MKFLQGIKNLHHSTFALAVSFRVLKFTALNFDYLSYQDSFLKNCYRFLIESYSFPENSFKNLIAFDDSTRYLSLRKLFHADDVQNDSANSKKLDFRTLKNVRSSKIMIQDTYLKNIRSRVSF